MRFALLALCLAGCFTDTSSSGDDYNYQDDGWGSGWGGSSGPVMSGCSQDSDCGGGTLVCARTRECLDSSQVRAIHTTWTVKGLAASTTTCANAPMLAITFSGTYGDQWGYAPVPCSSGKFTVDKFPTRYTQVQLARETDYSGGASGTFDATGTAALDLPY